MDKLQNRIIKELNVKPVINNETEITLRIGFLKKYLKRTNKKGYVLSISGGQDSALAGRIAQLAVEQLRLETGENHEFYALRLPYGIQQDEKDAQLALKFIQPDHVITINIKDAVDSAVRSFQKGTNHVITDYLKGNIKARERMKVHYDVAGYYDLLVIGTDHAAEAVTGFFTKHGDGGCDVLPLAGLTKRQGRKILAFLGAPKKICTKAPTADLLDDHPGLADEEELNLNYEAIDDYLEGKNIPEEIRFSIENRYLQTAHKRRIPVTPFDDWWHVIGE